MALSVDALQQQLQDRLEKSEYNKYKPSSIDSKKVRRALQNAGRKVEQPVLRMTSSMNQGNEIEAERRKDADTAKMAANEAISLTQVAGITLAMATAELAFSLSKVKMGLDWQFKENKIDENHKDTVTNGQSDDETLLTLAQQSVNQYNNATSLSDLMKSRDAVYITETQLRTEQNFSEREKNINDTELKINESYYYSLKKENDKYNKKLGEMDSVILSKRRLISGYKKVEQDSLQTIKDTLSSKKNGALSVYQTNRRNIEATYPDGEERVKRLAQAKAIFDQTVKAAKDEYDIEKSKIHNKFLDDVIKHRQIMKSYENNRTELEAKHQSNLHNIEEIRDSRLRNLSEKRDALNDERTNFEKQYFTAASLAINQRTSSVLENERISAIPITDHDIRVVQKANKILTDDAYIIDSSFADVNRLMRELSPDFKEVKYRKFNEKSNYVELSKSMEDINNALENVRNSIANLDTDRLSDIELNKITTINELLDGIALRGDCSLNSDTVIESARIKAKNPQIDIVVKTPRKESNDAIRNAGISIDASFTEINTLMATLIPGFSQIASPNISSSLTQDDINTEQSKLRQTVISIRKALDRIDPATITPDKQEKINEVRNQLNSIETQNNALYRAVGKPKKVGIKRKDIFEDAFSKDVIEAAKISLVLYKQQYNPHYDTRSLQQRLNEIRGCNRKNSEFNDEMDMALAVLIAIDDQLSRSDKDEDKALIMQAVAFVNDDEKLSEIVERINHNNEVNKKRSKKANKKKIKKWVIHDADIGMTRAVKTLHVKVEALQSAAITLFATDTEKNIIHMGEHFDNVPKEIMCQYHSTMSKYCVKNLYSVAGIKASAKNLNDMIKTAKVEVSSIQSQISQLTSKQMTEPDKQLFQELVKRKEELEAFVAEAEPVAKFMKKNSNAISDENKGIECQQFKLGKLAGAPFVAMASILAGQSVMGLVAKGKNDKRSKTTQFINRNYNKSMSKLYSSSDRIIQKMKRKMNEENGIEAERIQVKQKVNKVVQAYDVATKVASGAVSFMISGGLLLNTKAYALGRTNSETLRSVFGNRNGNGVVNNIQHFGKIKKQQKTATNIAVKKFNNSKGVTIVRGMFAAPGKILCMSATALRFATNPEELVKAVAKSAASTTVAATARLTTWTAKTAVKTGAKATRFVWSRTTGVRHKASSAIKGGATNLIEKSKLVTNVRKRFQNIQRATSKAARKAASRVAETKAYKAASAAAAGVKRAAQSASSLAKKIGGKAWTAVKSIFGKIWAVLSFIFGIFGTVFSAIATAISSFFFMVSVLLIVIIMLASVLDAIEAFFDQYSAQTESLVSNNPEFILNMIVNYRTEENRLMEIVTLDEYKEYTVTSDPIIYEAYNDKEHYLFSWNAPTDYTESYENEKAIKLYKSLGGTATLESNLQFSTGSITYYKTTLGNITADASLKDKSVKHNINDATYGYSAKQGKTDTTVFQISNAKDAWAMVDAMYSEDDELQRYEVLSYLGIGESQTAKVKDANDELILNSNLFWLSHRPDYQYVSISTISDDAVTFHSTNKNTYKVSEYCDNYATVYLNKAQKLSALDETLGLTTTSTVAAGTDQYAFGTNLQTYTIKRTVKTQVDVSTWTQSKSAWPSKISFVSYYVSSEAVNVVVQVANSEGKVYKTTNNGNTFNKYAFFDLSPYVGKSGKFIKGNKDTTLKFIKKNYSKKNGKYYSSVFTLSGDYYTATYNGKQIKIPAKEIMQLQLKTYDAVKMEEEIVTDYTTTDSNGKAHPLATYIYNYLMSIKYKTVSGKTVYITNMLDNYNEKLAEGGWNQWLTKEFVCGILGSVRSETGGCDIDSWVDPYKWGSMETADNDYPDSYGLLQWMPKYMLEDLSTSYTDKGKYYTFKTIDGIEMKINFDCKTSVDEADANDYTMTAVPLDFKTQCAYIAASLKTKYYSKYTKCDVYNKSTGKISYTLKYSSGFENGRILTDLDTATAAIARCYVRPGKVYTDRITNAQGPYNYFTGNTVYGATSGTPFQYCLGHVQFNLSLFVSTYDSDFSIFDSAQRIPAQEEEEKGTIFGYLNSDFLTNKYGLGSVTINPYNPEEDWAEGSDYRALAESKIPAEISYDAAGSGDSLAVPDDIIYIGDTSIVSESYIESSDGGGMGVDVEKEGSAEAGAAAAVIWEDQLLYLIKLRTKASDGSINVTNFYTPYYISGEQKNIQGYIFTDTSYGTKTLTCKKGLQYLTIFADGTFKLTDKEIEYDETGKPKS